MHHCAWCSVVPETELKAFFVHSRQAIHDLSSLFKMCKQVILGKGYLQNIDYNLNLLLKFCKTVR